MSVTFAVEIEKEVEDELIDPINEAVGDAGMSGWDEAYSSTPLWTGRLRSSWRLTLNKASSSKGSPYKKDKGRGVDLFAAETSRSRSSANASMDRFDVMKHKQIALTNNVVYAPNIEAANGMATSAYVKMNRVLNSRFSRI